MINFSIIIPHYDTPQLLERCLKSIPERNDIQVIVVDDHSPGIEDYLSLYPILQNDNVLFITLSTSGGAGHARNVGLSKAVGKWLLFADSDDFFSDEMPTLIDEHVDSVADIVFFRKRSVLSSDISLEIPRSSWHEDIFHDYLTTGREDCMRCNFPAPWAKMIRRDMIERYNIRFDEVRYSNDYYFSVMCGCKADKILVVNKFLYVVTVRDNSLSAGFCTKPGELEIRADVCFRVQKLINESEYKLSEEPFKMYLWLLFLHNKRKYGYYFRRLNQIHWNNYYAFSQLSSLLNWRAMIKCVLYSYWCLLREK